MRPEFPEPWYRRSLRLSRARLFTLLFLPVLGAGCAPSAPVETPAPVEAPGVEAAVEAHLTASAVQSHVEFLASDEMRGRDTPSPELDRAAAYIADHFRHAGLEAAGDGPDDFLQRWPLQRMVLDAAVSRADATGPGAEQRWRYGVDYFAIPGPDRAVEGSPLFLSDPSAAGGGLPSEAAGRPLLVYLSEGLGPEFGLAIQAGMQAGVSGVVLLMDEDTDESDIYQTAAALEGGAAGSLPLPVFGLRHEVGRELLASVGIEPAGGRDPPEVLGELHFDLQATFVPQVDEVPNVVGLLRGSDAERNGEYVVLTAHFDHVGVGPPDARGDSIFNGADDNASGTSALMQVAAALAALPEAPARSVVFLAVSGEEKGLLGSAHYAQNPTVPQGAMVANLNMDMVGRNHPDTVYAIGDDYTTIGETVRRIAAERPEIGLVPAPDPEPEEQVFLRSDHFSFVQVGVPALMLTTWLHDEYHLPSDTPELVDADKLSRVGRLIFHLTLELANAPEAPEWTPEGRALLDTLP